MESFDESRRDLIKGLLESFIGRRDETVLLRFNHTERFIDWVDNEGYKNTFTDEVQAQNAYRDYTALLNHQIAHQLLKPTTAFQIQSVAAKLIEIVFPDAYHNILAGAIKIKPERGSESASGAHVALYTDACLAIAEQCGDFVLENRPYPCVVIQKNHDVVIFPSFHGAVGPYRASALSYNGAERRVSTVDEYISSCTSRGRKPSNRGQIAADLAGTQAHIDLANEDDRHWHRLHMAYFSAKAYMCLFLLITGATPSELAQFTYEDAQGVEKSPLKKELSAVKFRASERATAYNIGRDTGLPLLKKYLKLRDWILNGSTHDRLFFSFPDVTKRRDFHGGFSEIAVTQAVSKFYKSISGVFLDPRVPMISARKMRKHKNNGMYAARISPSTVAAAMNHTEAVNLSTYADATPEQLDTEFGRFWQSMRHAANVVRERSRASSENEIETSTAAGHCDAFNKPKPVVGVQVNVELNCRTQFGCLYCEHYVCHSDQEDVHKLMSLQYVIDAVRRSAPDMAHAEELYRDLSIRIDFVVEALSERSGVMKQVVEDIKIRVFQYGELTPFWENRLSRYEKLGVSF
ncbi:hypothetical protein [Pseudomonas sp. 65/3-MNA-CIBAN-0223]|uniref:hypothetical protein n=1 Tax=Pseudomonas sp. 65/3-MNA-CIBAN-0223 TaxID=3140476 RepID=UPI0033240402